MKTLDEKLKDRQVAMIMKKAKESGLKTLATDLQGGHLGLEVSGEKIGLFSDPNIKAWAKNARIVASDVGLRKLVWEAAYFEPALAPKTKPDGSLPDAEVMKLIPKAQIDSHTFLVSVLRDLDRGIEAAYPEVLLSEHGFGLGKKKLVESVILALDAEGIVSRNVVGSSWIVFSQLWHHLQVHPNESLKTEQPLQSVQARSQ